MRALRPALLACLLSGCHLLLPLGPPSPDGPGADADGGRSDRMVGGDLGGCPWTVRHRVTFDGCGAGCDLVDVPVAVVLDGSLPNLPADGRDLRFIDAAGTALPHQIETWDQTGRCAVWVRLPRVTAQGGFIWLYLGNPAAGPGLDPTDVWHDGFQAVWHMDGLQDSTAGAHHLVAQTTMPTPGLVAGQAGAALVLDGKQYMTATLQVPAEYTLEARFWLDRYTTEPHLVEPTHVQFMVDDINHRLEAGTGDEFDVAETQCTTTVELKRWYHAAFVQGAGGWSLHLDGRQEAHGPEQTSPDPEIFVGDIHTTPKYGDSCKLDGLLDEVRISGVARPAAWIALQPRAMSGELATVGPGEPVPAGVCP